MNKKETIIKWTVIVLAIAINVLIIVSAFMDAKKSTSESSWAADIVENVLNFFNKNAVNDANRAEFHGVIRKLIGHFGLFFIDGVLSTFSVYFLLKNTKNNKHYWLLTTSLSFGLLIAIISECIQLAIPGRSGEVLDILIDFSGYLLSSLIIYLIMFFNIYKKKETQYV